MDRCLTCNRRHLGLIAPALYVDDAFEANGGAHGATVLAWLRRYRRRLAAIGRPDRERCAVMNAINPIVVPRNYLAQVAIDRAEAGDDSGIAELLDALRRPYELPVDPAFAAKRPEWARNRAGCSMLSCSS